MQQRSNHQRHAGAEASRNAEGKGLILDSSPAMSSAPGAPGAPGADVADVAVDGGQGLPNRSDGSYTPVGRRLPTSAAPAS